MNKTLSSKQQNPCPFLIGTDWWTDCDDAVAMRIFARAQLDGIINIEGIGINACMEHSCVSLDAFLRAEGLPDIKIGIDLAAVDYGGNPPYQKRLASYPSKYKSNADCEDAVRLYRRVLAQSGGDLEIIEIGYMQVLADVLKSGGDDLSPLTGLELFRAKVKKLWIMAGKWDEPQGGRENNFCRNRRTSDAAEYFLAYCPCPITFLGFEISEHIRTGGVLKGKENDLLSDVLKDHGSEDGRSSWDPMLALLAVMGDEERAGYSTVRGTASVKGETGENIFTPDKNGLHAFVIKTKPDGYYKEIIEKIISL